PAGRPERPPARSDRLGGHAVREPRTPARGAAARPPGPRRVDPPPAHPSERGSEPEPGGHQAHASARGGRAPARSENPRPRGDRPGPLREPRAARYHPLKNGGGETPPPFPPRVAGGHGTVSDAMRPGQEGEEAVWRSR